MRTSEQRGEFKNVSDLKEKIAINTKVPKKVSKNLHLT
jgi:hypothetical protein